MTADVEGDVVNIEIDDHSLSPVERIGIVLSEWLKDHPSRRTKRRPRSSEAVVFALIVALVLSVIAGALNGLAYGSLAHFGTRYLILVVTQWADVPTALILLGTALLAHYESRRSCDEFESWIGQDEDDDDARAGDGEAGVEHLRWLSRKLRRTRSATVLIATLGLLIAAAALVTLGDVIYAAVSARASVTWHDYLGLVLSELAPAVVALAGLLIASRAWAEESELLRFCGTSELLVLRDQTPP
jgi:hypothetical protein